MTAHRSENKFSNNLKLGPNINTDCRSWFGFLNWLELLFLSSNLESHFSSKNHLLLFVGTFDPVLCLLSRYQISESFALVLSCFEVWNAEIVTRLSHNNSAEKRSKVSKISNSGALSFDQTRTLLAPKQVLSHLGISARRNFVKLV